ncbi:SDR family NAD(P)-dependent oxidoreductase [Marinilabilia rubra]|uniref:Oxidoreductase n=1 Tax=Marinilabilia rubra TaxID=2162893 RepID=A0A2U2B521_9BACT|nr:SDR family oxidoreductase [Marinilabilia rubra]PWD98134.1 oxidoreductase [Marinilabilia rubra]
MKNYLIVGGSSGIGKKLVELLAENGHNVYATFNEKPQEDSDNVHFSQMNILGEDVPDVEFLPESLDGMVYCPGSINLKPFHRIKEQEFLDDYRLQVIGAVKIIQAALPRLKKSGHASVVLFSTVAVQSGFNFHSIVSSSKGAVEGLTRALAAELAPSVRVNAVAPSLTDTPLAGRLLSNDGKKAALGEKNPMKRVGEPADIAHAVKFLLGEESSWVTGQILHVDGGASSLTM